MTDYRLNLKVNTDDGCCLVNSVKTLSQIKMAVTKVKDQLP